MHGAATTRKPYSPRRSRAERREQVLDAALRVLDRDGFAGLTVEAVAREADLAKTVVYAIGNREKLTRTLLAREHQRAMEHIAAAMPMPPFDHPEDLLAGGISALLEAVGEHPATWRLILLPPEGTPPSVRDEVERTRERLRAQLEPVVRWGLGQLAADDMDPEIATHALLAAVEAGVRMTLTDPRRFPPQRLADFGRALVRRVA